jgi:hypothetical protein
VKTVLFSESKFGNSTIPSILKPNETEIKVLENKGYREFINVYKQRIKSLDLDDLINRMPKIVLYSFDEYLYISTLITIFLAYTEEIVDVRFRTESQMLKSIKIREFLREHKV